MPYEIEGLTIPSEIDVNNRFEIIANVCCVSGEGGFPESDEPCEPSEVKLKLYRMVSGPLGMWDFPLVSSMLKRDKEVLLSQQVEFQECEDFRDRPKISTPGTYKIVATVGDQKKTDTFEVEAV